MASKKGRSRRPGNDRFLIRQVRQPVAAHFTVAHLIIVTSHPRDQGNLILRQLVDVSLVALYIMTMATEPGLQTIHLPLDNRVPRPQVANQLLIIVSEGDIEFVHLLQLSFQTHYLEKPSGQDSSTRTQSLTAYLLTFSLQHRPQSHRDCQ